MVSFPDIPFMIPSIIVDPHRQKFQNILRYKRFIVLDIVDYRRYPSAQILWAGSLVAFVGWSQPTMSVIAVLAFCPSPTGETSKNGENY
jgi:hypothetical protein